MKKANRILKHEEFAEIMASAPCLKSPHFVAYHRLNTESRARVGISVSKRNGNSVVRNLIKRQIRSVVGAHLDLKIPLDLVLIVRASYNPEKFTAEEAELIPILKKIGEKP